MQRYLEPGRTPRKFDSVQRLSEEHQEVTEEFCRRKKVEAEAMMALPPPPLPGNEFVVPLVSTLDLHDEGRQQKNCAATYAEKIRAGDCYLYRVMQPERATLSIAKGSDGS